MTLRSLICLLGLVGLVVAGTNYYTETAGLTTRLSYDRFPAAQLQQQTTPPPPTATTTPTPVPPTPTPAPSPTPAGSENGSRSSGGPPILIVFLVIIFGGIAFAVFAAIRNTGRRR
jgi:hypothetical protein